MPSTFDAEFQTAVVPDIFALFGETAVYVPRDWRQKKFNVVAIFEQPRGDRNMESDVETESNRWDILVLASVLKSRPEIGDVITRTVAGSERTYRLTASEIAPVVENDSSGAFIQRLHAVETGR